MLICRAENIKGAGMETAIVQALRGLIVQIKVATQSVTPAPAKRPAETVRAAKRVITKQGKKKKQGKKEKYYKLPNFYAYFYSYFFFPFRLLRSG